MCLLLPAAASPIWTMSALCVPCAPKELRLPSRGERFNEGTLDFTAAQALADELSPKI